MINIQTLENLSQAANQVAAFADDAHRALPYLKAFVQAIVPIFQELIAGLKAEFLKGESAAGSTQGGG